MPQPRIKVTKNKMPAAERDLRARLAQLINDKELLRGTLHARAITCGKSTCKCARGEKHAYLFLVVSENGKLRQILIPRPRQAAVRQWVEHYQQAQELLEEISHIYRDRIRPG